MALAIDSDLCIACGDCQPVCPTEAIHVTRLIYAILPMLCTECADLHPQPQCQHVCTVDDCIQPLPE